MTDLLHLRWIRRTTFLCLVLLCVSGLAQTLHSHPQDQMRGDADSGKARCTICVAQSPQQAAAKVHVLPTEARELAVAANDLSRTQQAPFSVHRTRPPPTL